MSKIIIIHKNFKLYIFIYMYQISIHGLLTKEEGWLIDQRNILSWIHRIIIIFYAVKVIIDGFAQTKQKKTLRPKQNILTNFLVKNYNGFFLFHYHPSIIWSYDISVHTCMFIFFVLRKTTYQTFYLFYYDILFVKQEHVIHYRGYFSFFLFKKDNLRRSLTNINIP